MIMFQKPVITSEQDKPLKKDHWLKETGLSSYLVSVGKTPFFFHYLITAILSFITTHSA